LVGVAKGFSIPVEDIPPAVDGIRGSAVISP